MDRPIDKLPQDEDEQESHVFLNRRLRRAMSRDLSKDPEMRKRIADSLRTVPVPRERRGG
jgi:hypothetical protein